MTRDPNTNVEPLPAGDELSEMLRGYVQAAQRLQKTHETLQHEIVRLRDELASKDRELERRRRLASLGELAAGVAHEVRNPLGAISLYSGLLRRECRNIRPAMELIRKIEAGIKAIDEVVQDTLALVPRAGECEIHLLQSILERARDLSLGVLRAAGATLEVRLEDPQLRIPAQREALQRVFVNLIANAAQAAPHGSVVRLHVATAGENWIEARVLDDGPGLPDGVADRVFDPFFTTKQNGTGLGLTIAHRLVELHGGRLSARNQECGGAEFVVGLPTERPAEAVNAPEENPTRTTAA